MMNVHDPTTDEVAIKTMLQCNRGMRIFAGIYNAEFEFFAVYSTFFNNHMSSKIYIHTHGLSPHLFLSVNQIKTYKIGW